MFASLLPHNKRHASGGNKKEKKRKRKERKRKKKERKRKLHSKRFVYRLHAVPNITQQSNCNVLNTGFLFLLYRASETLAQNLFTAMTCFGNRTKDRRNACDVFVLNELWRRKICFLGNKTNTIKQNKQQTKTKQRIKTENTFQHQINKVLQIKPQKAC